MDPLTVLCIFTATTIVASVIFGVWLETKAYGTKRGLIVLGKFIVRMLCFGALGTAVIMLFIWLGDKL